MPCFPSTRILTQHRSLYHAVTVVKEGLVLKFEWTWPSIFCDLRRLLRPTIQTGTDGETSNMHFYSVARFMALQKAVADERTSADTGVKSYIVIRIPFPVRPDVFWVSTLKKTVFGLCFLISELLMTDTLHQRRIWAT